MRNFLRLYSNVLQLREETFRALKHSPRAVPFALSLFFLATLLAGCGLWIGLPNELAKPTLAEQIGFVDAAVTRINSFFVPRATSALDAVSRENLSFALGEVLPLSESISAAGLAEAIDQAGLSGEDVARLLAEQTALNDAAREALSRADVTAEDIESLLAETDITPERLRILLSQAATAAAEGGLSDQLAGLSLGGQSLQSLVTELALTPERVRDFVVIIGLSPETVSRLKAQIETVPEATTTFLGGLRASAENLEPPLGPRPSRFINFLGRWLSTPFQIMIAYLPIVLAALLVARALGGRATLSQHLVAAALAAAPAFLLLLATMPDVGRTMPVTVEVALRLIGRLFGLIGIIWALVILVKSLAVAHDFSIWRAAGTLILTYAVVYVLLPFLGFLALGYILRG